LVKTQCSIFEYLDAIKTGEESFKDKAITEEALVEKMKETLRNQEKTAAEERLKKRNLNDMV